METVVDMFTKLGLRQLLVTHNGRLLGKLFYTGSPEKIYRLMVTPPRVMWLISPFLLF